MRNLATRWLAAIALLATPSVLATQDAEMLPIAQRMAEVRGEFQRTESVLQARIASGGWGALRDTLRFQLLRGQIGASLDRFERKPGPDDTPSLLGRRMQDYFESADSIYSFDMAPEFAAPMNRIILDLLNHLQLLNDEYYRRFFIKYGRTSERLNLLEMALLNAWSRDPVGLPEQQLGPWEPILRIQSVGYQVSLDDGDFGPAPPVAQVGATYYLFANTRAARLVHHVGLAAAYQHGLGTGENRWGAVAHVNRLDVGLLCTSWPCCRRQQ